MNEKELLVKAKIAALLHDPPWKAYALFKSVLEGSRRGREIISGMPRYMKLKEHEKDSYILSRSLDTQPMWNNPTIKALVQQADRVASSIDRLKLPRDAPTVKKIILINIFNPQHVLKNIEQKPPRPDDIFEKYIDALHETLSWINDPLLRYHVLWTLYEPLWYREFPKHISPADTRIPTHTVFNHTDATTQTINLLNPEKPGEIDGFLVMIDYGGVQGFIRESRKLRDLWASSWMASLISWLTIEEVVGRLGPDIVVSPHLRLNPYYHTWLIDKVREAAGPSSRMIEDKFRELLGWRGWPRHPIMPTTTILILPRIKIDEDMEFTGKDTVKQYFINRARKVWASIVDNMKDEVEDVVKVFGNGIIKPGEVIQLLRDNPPLPLRVIVLDIGEEYEKFKEWAGSMWDGGLSLFYHYLLTVRLGEEASRFRLLKHDPRAFSEKWRAVNMAKTRFCTSCGRHPAIVVADSDAGVFERKASAIEKTSKYIVSPGERLCPYCLLKRIVSFHYDRLIERLYSRVRIPPSSKIYIPSTNDVALSCRIPSLIAELKKSSELLSVIGRLIGVTYEPAGLPEKIRRMMGEKLDEGELGNLLSAAALVIEYVLQRRDVEERLRRVFHGVPEPALKSLINEIDRVVESAGFRRVGIDQYYAMIRGDGDRIGDLLAGRLPMDTDEYYRVLKGALYELMRKSFVDEWISSVVKTVRDFHSTGVYGAGSTIIITPTVEAAISRALSAVSMMDADVIEGLGGVPIYVGGDDLLGVSPRTCSGEEIASAIPPLGIVAETRLNYQGRMNGFNIPGSKAELHVLTQGLTAYGRSYSIIIAHYKDPLDTVIAESVMALENAKNRIRVKDADTKSSYNRDILALDSIRAQSRIAMGGAWITPLYPYKPRIRKDRDNYGLLADMLESLIDEYSRSVIYDILSDAERISRLVQASPGLAAQYCLRILKRNKKVGSDRQTLMEEICGRLLSIRIGPDGSLEYPLILPVMLTYKLLARGVRK